MKGFLIAIGLLAAAPAYAQDASGKWQLSVTTEQRGTQTTSMALKKDGDKLSGTVAGPRDSILSVAGTQSGADVSLSFTVPTDDGAIAVSMEGRQDGDSMTGTLKAGTDLAGSWTATRHGAATTGTTVDLTGRWALQVETEAGARTATAALTQEGGKLTGHYASQLGEAPLTGQITGNAFSFQVTLPIEGTPMAVLYTGSVDAAGAASGRVSIGDVEVGTFTGKRDASR